MTIEDDPVVIASALRAQMRLEHINYWRKSLELAHTKHELACQAIEIAQQQLRIAHWESQQGKPFPRPDLDNNGNPI